MVFEEIKEVRMKITDVFTADVYKVIRSNPIAVGASLNFKAVDTDLQEVELGQFPARFKIISVTPSLDTPVCFAQTKKLDKLIARADGLMISVSLDLPFAQKRSCAFRHGRKHLLWSDYLYRDFATQTGLNMKRVGLLCRAVLVVDANNMVVYRQVANPVKVALDFEDLFLFLKTNFDVQP